MLVRFTAIEFGDLVRNKELEKSIEIVKGKHPNKKITVIIEGKESFLRRENSRIQKAYQGKRTHVCLSVSVCLGQRAEGRGQRDDWCVCE